MHRQWDNEMMKMANGEIDNVSGTTSCTSIKNSSEDLEMYYIVVCTKQMCLFWLSKFNTILTIVPKVAF